MKLDEDIILFLKSTIFVVGNPKKSGEKNNLDKLLIDNLLIGFVELFRFSTDKKSSLVFA